MDQKDFCFIHIDVEAMGPVKSGDMFQLSMLAHKSDSNMLPNIEHPFEKEKDELLIDQVTIAIKFPKHVNVQKKMNDFWKNRKDLFHQIMESAVDPLIAISEINNFLYCVSQTHKIAALVMSPTWYDWSHFVHFYSLFSDIISNLYDISKLNVICLKSLSFAARMCGIKLKHHPELPHTHNAHDDVKAAAFTFCHIIYSFRNLKKMFPCLDVMIQTNYELLEKDSSSEIISNLSCCHHKQIKKNNRKRNNNRHKNRRRNNDKIANESIKNEK